MSELVVTAAAVAILPSRGIAFILELWCWRPVSSTREPENIWNCRQKAKVPVRKFLTFESLQTTNTRSRQLRGFRKLVFDGFRYHQSSSGKHSENPKIVLVKKLKVHSKTLRSYLKKIANWVHAIYGEFLHLSLLHKCFFVCKFCHRANTSGLERHQHYKHHHNLFYGEE